MKFKGKRDKLDLVRNMNVSVLLACDDVKRFVNCVSVNCKYFERNGIEVVVIVSGPVDEAVVIGSILEYPLVNWKVVKCDEAVSFLDYLSIGRETASKERVLLMDTALVFTFDIVQELVVYAEHFDRSFVVYRPFRDDTDYEGIPYMLVSRQGLKDISITPEIDGRYSLIDTIQRRLQRNRFRRIQLRQSARDRKQYFETGFVTDITSPQSASDPTASHYEVLYDWRIASYGGERCARYLSSFLNFHIPDQACFNKRYRTLALVQTYNERSHVPDVLDHLDQHCDGIILLDDQSTDGTYEAAHSEKLLLKVRKTRAEFNDLQNRNLLLDIVSFFQSDWIFFFDADERFDVRYSDIYSIASNTRSNVISFWRVNLWDDEKMYRADSINNLTSLKDGLQCRPRMFRNIGRAQIMLTYSRKLHFDPIPMPIMDDYNPSKILLLDYGLLNSVSRLRKFDFYKQEDKDVMYFGYSYDGILQEAPSVKNVDSIVLPDF